MIALGADATLLVGASATRCSEWKRPLPLPRRIDTSLALSRHLKTWEDLPRPWDAAALFGRDAPLEVEVGSGKAVRYLGNYEDYLRAKAAEAAAPPPPPARAKAGGRTARAG